MTIQQSISPRRPQPYMRLAELLMGSRIALALRTIAELGIADILGDDTQSAEQLSAQVGIPAQSLTRLLRSLSYVGVFEESSDGRFANTDISSYLRSDVDPSLREMSLILNDDAVLRAWQDLPHVLQTGEPAFAAVNGQTFFEHIASDAKRSETMARFMKGIYGPEGPRIAAGFPFGRFRKVLDVGGGTGHILTDILRTHPEIQGAIFELPRTADVARRFLSNHGLAPRCEVFAGDFFKAVTPGYDAYFIKSTLHDWDDEKATQILKNCRDAMPAHGRILVTEIVLEPGKPIGHPHPFVDLEMMVSFGGRERTANEFANLLQQTGLRLEHVHPIEGSFFSIVEGAKA